MNIIIDDMILSDNIHWERDSLQDNLNEHIICLSSKITNDIINKTNDYLKLDEQNKLKKIEIKYFFKYISIGIFNSDEERIEIVVEYNNPYEITHKIDNSIKVFLTEEELFAAKIISNFVSYCA